MRHFVKRSSRKALTFLQVFLGIKNKKPQVSIKRTEDSEPWGSYHPAVKLIGAQLNQKYIILSIVEPTFRRIFPELA